MGQLVRVDKQGRQLTVDEHAVNYYLEQGYNQIDENGKIVKRATSGVEITKEEHYKALDEIERLKAQTGDGAGDRIAELELQLADAKDEIAELKKTISAQKGEITKLKGASK